MADEQKLRDYLTRVVAELQQTRQRLRAASEKAPESIAIVAMSCRYPGGVTTPEELWRLLSDGTDAVSGFPVDRGWDLEALYDPEPGKPGKTYAVEGGFLYDATDFDPGFFGISPREAVAMDPQQRLLLETSWEAFERAGIPMDAVRGSTTGVFVGASTQGYGMPEGASGSEGHVLTGNVTSVLSGRIAYTFDLDGPAVTIDTACSSSLVALHLAAQALRAGECEMALAGGVTVMAGPGGILEFARQRGLASDGRCKAYADGADGMGMGEGAGVVLVERLSDAVANGHPVLAVLRGSAVNSDGASNGLTAPNGPSQQRVIRQALANARLSVDQVDAVEGHGTGTALGDPIEAQALLATYGRNRERPLWLGSVKSNIGHTQAAAGIAGVMKMVLALRHGTLPRTLHAETPSSEVDWTAGSVSLLTDPVPWPETGEPRRAGVSSFGISGTNAHVILESAPPAVVEAETATRALPVVPWVLSAKSDEALTAQTTRLAQLWESSDAGQLDIGASLATTRAALSHRAVVLDPSALSDLSGPSVVRGVVAPGKSAVLFTGQGSQRPGMGRELAEAFPVFAEAFDAVCAELDRHLDRPIRNTVFHDDDGAGVLDQTVYAQAGLFALQVALFRLIESWGVVPDSLLGHSIGELAAAHVAGVWDLPDAARVVAARGRLMQALPEGGAMVAVEATEDEVIPLLVGAGVSLAAVNGPTAVVLSGERSAVAGVVDRLGDRRVRWLRVSHAFHSELMDPMLAEYRAVLSSVVFREPVLPVVSTVTGALAGTGWCDPEYWVRQVRETVRFAEGMAALDGVGVSRFLELGPDGVLSAMGQDCAPEGVFVPVLRRDRPEPETVVGALASLWVTGMPVDWGACFVGTGAGRVDLPTYPFQRERYWPVVTAPSGETDARQLTEEDARFWEAVDRSDLSGLADGLDLDGDQPLREVLPKLSSWRREHRELSVVDGWRYGVDWRPLSVNTRSELAGTWLLIGSSDQLDHPVVAGLARRGARFVPLLVGESGLDRAGFTRELGAVLAEHPEPAGILSLLGMSEDCLPELPEIPTGLITTLALAQALHDIDWPSPVWCLTTGAVSTGPSDPLHSPVQAQIWGLGRVIGLEQPGRWGGLIDLPPTLDDRALDRISTVLTGTEDQIALRPTGVLARRLVHAPATRPGAALALRDTILITGGTGALATHVARWATSAGVDRVVLASRRGPSAPGAVELREELAATGVDVEVLRCDVTDRQALAELVSEVDSGGSPVRAVVHTAGVGQLTPLPEITGEEFVHVLRAKVLGAANLDAVFAGRELDAFVLFSSIASIWGSGGQGAYAAANAYLDAVAVRRRQRGLVATAVAWGPWAEGGMAEGAAGEHLLRHGLPAMPAELAVVGLRQAVVEGDAVVAVAEVEWERFAPAYAASRVWPLIGELPVAVAALERVGGGEPDEEQSSVLRARLVGMGVEEQRRLLVELVRSEAAGVLGHASVEGVESGQAFREMGFDSLTAVELRGRLTAVTGLSLPATLVFDYPTPEVLAQGLRDIVFGADPVDVPVAPPRDADDEPIAIVAMSCRYPGGVSSPEDLWRLVADGTDAVGEFPTDRGWDVERLYDEDPDQPGTTYCREGGFLDGATRFDPDFFGISPREALAMDPQQRILLEATWEVFERAGIDPVTADGSTTGVFVGTNGQDYPSLLAMSPDALEGYLGTGNAASVVSGRVSYTFGLQGPAVTVDTACSSSLVALHLAARALRAGECSMALAGGVTVMATPSTFVDFSRQRGLAPDGRCKSFGEAADGTGWAEGVGVLLVERLSDARRLGHPVLAVLRGSAVNSDGASNGLTAPNGPSQQRVIRQALADAGLSPTQVDAVEAHGTGTVLGDPIEAQAVLASYGQDRDEDRPLWLGSLKSNIGHAQAAAGVGGVIKMVMAMRHGMLPRSLHIDAPTSHVDWSSGAVALLTEQVPWPETGEPRRAAVSAFGVSGTNAHVIVESPPREAEKPRAEAPAPPVVPWLLSAKSPAALADQARRLLAHVQDQDQEPDRVDVAYSLATSRAALPHRAVVFDEADLADLDTSPGVVRGVASDGRVAFLFSGQGAQRATMGRGLFEAYPTYADAFDAVCAELDRHLDRPVRDVVFEGGDLIDQTVHAQAGLFAVEVALFRLLESWGVTPDLVLGHSIGELAAAHVAGAMSLTDAAELVAARGALMQALPGGGAMVSLRASESEVAPLLSDRVSLAAVNGPGTVVLSGDDDAVADVVSRFPDRKSTRLRVSHAFHSAHMDGMLDDFRAVAGRLTLTEPTIPVVSTLTGGVVTDELRDPEHWVRQVREPVRFAEGMATLRDQAVTTFLELGPDGALAALAGVDTPVIPLLRRGREEPRAVVTALAELHVRGGAVDWGTFFAGVDARRVDLPTYAFQHERFWPAGTAIWAGDASAFGLRSADHALLGAAMTLADSDGLVLTGRLSTRSHPWLADHVVLGSVLLPGTAFVELALHAGQRVGCGLLEELTLHAPLVLDEHGGAAVQVTVGAPDGAGRRPVRVSSSATDDEDQWRQHATGVLAPLAAHVAEGLQEWPPAGAEPVDVDDFYTGLAAAGFEYGPAFRGVRAAWRRGDGVDAQVFAEVALPEDVSVERFGIHPALLDAALHPLSLAGSGQWGLPFAWSGVRLTAVGATAARVRITPGGSGVSVTVADVAGEPLATVDSLALRPPQGQPEPAGPTDDALLRVAWPPLPLPDGAADKRVVVLGDPAWLAPLGLPAHGGLAELTTVPDVVVVTVEAAGTDQVSAVHDSSRALLRLVREWLTDDRFAAARLAVVTRGGAGPDGASDLAGAAAWGLLRSAQTENPGRLVLVDVDTHPATPASVIAALSTGEPQVAVREGEALVPRLRRASTTGALRAPAATPWRLDTTGAGTIDALALVPVREATEPPSGGMVRVGVRAAGVNFRDVLIALGMYPGDATMGIEGAGVVLDVGPDVTGLAPGDRVMGLLTGGFGPVALTDHRMLARIPDGWSFTDAAATPVAFMTAYYALVDLAGVRAGERVLVHAAAGGVGMAAVRLAHHLGAEVFATASPGKWPVVRELGVDDDHLSSSRTVEFERKFRDNSGGDGVDVVLNSLTGEFLDASLRLLADGGRFVEMGKTDPRDPDGVSYRAFDLVEAGPERIGQLLAEVLALFERGALRPLPVRTWDVRRAPEAFRYLAKARHVGKVVLTVPAPEPHHGTVLVTGATGALGGLVARHLVTEHHVPSLLLAGRRGADAPGMAELADELRATGAQVTLAACDVADRDALAELLAGIPAEQPLTGVVHAAGLLDDGVVTALTPDRLDAVLRPKVDAAWHLHELTAHLDLSLFVLFSSVAGVFGAPGQANYAAANAVLDGLAELRGARGLVATSAAWGPWSAGGGMMGELADGDSGRVARSGIVPLTRDRGLALLDAAVLGPHPAVVPVGLDVPALRGRASSGGLQPVLHELARVDSRRRAETSDDSALARRLTGLPPAERDRAVLDLVRGHVAAVLGHPSPEAIDVTRPFSELGFDSLTAVELRNRLGAATGARLPATLVFDHPTPAVLAGFVLAELLGAAPVTDEETPAPVHVDEPIAIVGMSCRFPGGVESPDDLWRLVLAGRDAVGPLPTDRGWRLDLPDGLEIPALQGGFLSGAGDFDAGFFGISPREALAMDPQQRLLLEATWESLEHAGIGPSGLRGSRTGVFAGTAYSSYGSGMMSTEQMRGHALTGTATSVISGRIAYSFGFEGPAVSVDTACSSSLVALHLAAQALRAGECTLALAGGVTVMTNAGVYAEFGTQQGLALDGRCKAFSEAADGTGWAEGAGMLVLERLSDARRNGHRVLAVVRGSAVNSDGASNGLTAPNGPSQQRVIRQALANARLSASEVDVVEAHGTGTALGDPIEAQALLATYGQDRPVDRPLWLGSIKSNIGHTQAAAGVAGLVKMVMALRHGVLPRTLHVDEPSTRVDWDAGAVSLLTEQRTWPETGRPRRAAVSSFGISGTNAHVLLEAWSEDPDRSEAVAPAPVVPWVLSARSAEALTAQAARLLTHVEDSGSDLVDVGYSLAATRSALPHRAVVLDRADLEDLATAPRAVRGVAEPGRLGLLFSGQGAQRSGMGRGLYEVYPTFAEAFDATCAELDKHLDRPLAPLVFGGGPLLDQTEYTQAGLFALEVALYRLVESWGVTADFLLGHSVGEIAAAHVAGVFSLADACRLVATRGRLMAVLPPGGAMVSLAATEDEVRPALDDRVAIAAVNAPGTLVLSGDEDAVDEVLTRFEGRRNRRLRVSHAFHSPRMDPVLAELRTVVSELAFAEPRLPLVSTVTGHVADTEVRDPEYWVRQVRETVRFSDALRSLDDLGVTTFLELGPDGGLAALGTDTLPGAVFAPALRRGRDEPETLVTGLATTHVHGRDVDWAAYFAGSGARRTDLPTYAFQHERYWLSAAEHPAGAVTSAGLGDVDHPLLGADVELAGAGERVFTGVLAVSAHPWLADHSVHGVAAVPTALLADLLLHVGHQVGAPRLADVTVERPLVVPESGSVRFQLAVRATGEDGDRRAELHSYRNDEWVRHATATLTGESDTPEVALADWPPPGAVPVSLDDHYERLADVGVAHGPLFRGLRAAWRPAGDETTVLVEVTLPEDTPVEGFTVHPALLDAAAQGSRLLGGDLDALPLDWTGVSAHAVGARALRVRISRRDQGFSLFAADDTGLPVVTVDQVTSATPVPEELLAASPADGTGAALHEVGWSPRSATDGDEDLVWAVLGDGTPLPTSAAGRHADLADLAARETIPDVVVTSVTTPGAAVVGATHDAVSALLGTLREWLADDRLRAARLVVLTRGAVATTPEADITDLPAAAAWGLVRSAQTENPGRLVLVDLGVDGDAERLPAVLASGEPQVAIRDGQLLVPRLVTSTAESVVPETRHGTVLVTGAGGALATLVARHLAMSGVPNLLLVSRRGTSAPGTVELLADLRELGTTAQVVACDVADRDALAGALERVPAERPLTGVVHTAGVLADGMLASLDAERVSAVLRPKVDGAWNLHELTRDLDLSLFTVFSSASGVLGALGQANYAAANAFLDGLAQHRRASGLPARSLAWGPWADGGMAGRLADAEATRMARAGLPPLSVEQGLALLDAAATVDRAALVPARLDLPALRARAAVEPLPPLFGELVPVAAGRRRAGTASGSSLTRRLAATPQEERATVVLDLVRDQAAAVLGHGTAQAVEVTRAFAEMGFDSLTAVEFRNRLDAATGARLPATLVFDYPTPVALAEFLLAELLGTTPRAADDTPVPARPDEPIAIIGMSCRFPGGVSSPEEFWRLLTEGTDAIGPFPGDRGWDLGRLHADDGPGTSPVREGGFLYDAPEFDAGFFGISPREALAMDPQQRLLLEATWESLEHAGIDPAGLRGSRTGVFAGTNGQDYVGLVLGSSDSGEGHLATGNNASIISGRVAYSFGFEGPAVSVDTACSSSLVALHLAAQALRAGECTLALAGGVTVMSTPGAFLELGAQGALSADGRCKAFGEGADGAGWSEGVGMLLVERLSDARRHGRRVLAVLRGSAVNQDGASNGLTAPNGPSQQRVIRHALANAGLATRDVDVVEAHGTGTALGDPIEAQAVLATYGQDRERPLLLGSVKSNIGHTQAAAGVAGVMKMVLALQHGALPRTLHADPRSSRVDWSAGDVDLLTEQVPWPDTARPRRAAVSAFGLSGTNAHAILEQAPDLPEAPVAGTPAVTATHVPLVFSGRTRDTVTAQARRLRSYLRDHEDIPLAALGHALSAGRARLDHRAGVVVANRSEALAALDRVIDGGKAPGIVRGRTVPAPRPVFVFPGQGSQWMGMAADLLASSPVFRAEVQACSDALAEHLGWSVLDVLSSGGTDEDGAGEDRVDRTQPVLFTVMVALARLWRAHGVEPAAVIGHSQGEIAAACVSGALSLADAAKVVALRSAALVALSGRGGMMSVWETADAVRDRIAPWADRLSVAAVNGPRLVVVTGEPGALDELAEACAADDVRTRRIAVDYASHSPQVDEIESELVSALAGISPGPGRVPCYSTLTGQRLDTSGMDAGYWYRNLRSSVEFQAAVRSALDDGHGVFVEVSPHPVLTVGLGEVFADAEVDAVAVGTLRRGEGGQHRFLTSLVEAYAHGVDLDWSSVFGGQDARVAWALDVPTYAFQRARYWPTPTATPTDGEAALDSPFWTAVENADLSGLASTLELADESAQASLGAVLPALTAWHRARGERSTLDSWRYRPDWQPISPASDGRLTGTWLLVVPGARANDELVDLTGRALRDHGALVEEVSVGATDLDRAHLARRLRALDEPPEGIVSLLALDEEPLPDAPEAPFGVAATLVLLQALGEAGLTARAWSLTQGAVSTGASEPAPRPAQAAVWGLGRVAALENPDRWGGLVDLPPAPDERAGTRLAALLAESAGEDQLAVRPVGVLARRLRRAPGGGAAGWEPTGKVLVTGGTGAIGGRVARWLAEHGATHLVLLSRRGESAPGAAELRDALVATGARVTFLATDVGDLDALTAAVRGADDGEPVRAVVHAAGTLDNGLLDTLGTERFSAALRAKLLGARNLHEACDGLDLDAFVLFSAFAGVVGGTGQGPYAAANAYLDALAERRRTAGLPATSVAWGTWAEDGAEEDPQVAWLRRRGLPALPASTALTALSRAVAQAEPPLLVADVDWRLFAPAFTAARPSKLIAELPEVAAVDAGRGDTGGDPDQAEALTSRLSGLSDVDAERVLLDVVRTEAAGVLGYTGVDEVEPQRPFRDVGFESLTAVELRDQLTARTGVRLPATLVFDHPTPVALAGFLRTQLVGGAEEAPASVFDELDRLEASLAAFTDDRTARGRVTARLRGLLAAWDEADGEEKQTVAGRLGSATADEVLAFIDNELGAS